ncbi:T-cell differentiation antigen CD6 isoform X7 [Pontoporia blainvillei]|uniref:T-cell differentiation antigen CD6 isoform X7 n=1 Tax=Pontoporia blainvillei TaxID=48723 RepID=A0ABX0S4F9_PONBL|nr:T-cell differentiation antigen CD6 isoform X7 [Pontoporia blainvillei]
MNGSSRCNGTAEVWFRQSWEPACGALWDLRASEAVCRSLGCGRAEPLEQPVSPTPALPPGAAAGNASWAPNTTWALAPTVQCSGPEWQLCKVVEHACSSDERPVQVTCAENLDLKLVGGGSPCEGRVEMLEHGQWGSVCDDTWDLDDAHVVCRQLSCGWAVQALPGLHFAPGQGRIHRDQVNCSGSETYLWDCLGLPGNGYCGHKEDAGVVCSEHQSWRLTGGADPCEGQVEVYFRGVWNTVCDKSSVTVKMKDWESRELMLLIPCIVLGILLLVSLSFIAIILLRIKGKYVPKLPIQVQAPPPEDSNSSSDSDYEPYDFGSQPPVALTTFYNSQRHRFTDEEVRQNRFQMPPLEEGLGLEEVHASRVPPANPEHCIADPRSMGPQHNPRSKGGSSTSSGEECCNSPGSRLPPWNSQVFSSERNPLLGQPLNLELAGSQATFPGSLTPQPDSSSNEDYDDIGAA